MPLQPPFTLVGTIDGGGLGELFSYTDGTGIKFVAKFPKDQHPDSQQLVIDEERRFYRHQGKHVVGYLGTVHLPDGRRGFAMELMEGSLSALVARPGSLTIRRAFDYFSQAAKGLHEIHASAAGAFHGDLKPANILYRGNTAKIADFGLARGGNGQTQMVGPHWGGTPGYLPPERATSPAGDVYSLGVTLWALLAGREAPRDGVLPPIILPGRLGSLVNGMIEADPSKRLSMSDVLTRLPAVKVECVVEEIRARVLAAGPAGAFAVFAAGLVGLGLIVVGGVALVRKATKA